MDERLGERNEKNTCEVKQFMLRNLIRWKSVPLSIESSAIQLPP